MLSMLSALLELVSPIYLASLFSRDSSIFTWNQLLLISSKFWIVVVVFNTPFPSRSQANKVPKIFQEC